MNGSVFFQEMAKKPPFSKLHPRLAEFFKDYLSHEKVIRFNGGHVVNTHFPPYPGPAFDSFVDNFSQIGDASHQQLYSVTLAVTNRCFFRCWHCYNAGRSENDTPLGVLRDVAAEIQDRGAVMVTLTGGEPMLRRDLEEIAGLFDNRSCLILGTTGHGLTPRRARALRERGLFGVGISLDSMDEAEHDRLRGVEGAFRTALNGLRTAAEAGLYPYIVSVAIREFLEPKHFWPFMEFARDNGALEVHLLEPSATGKLAGQTKVVLHRDEKDRMVEYQKECAGNEDLPILSSYGYLESADTFGCGAGLTHLYIDGSGEVSPCQLVPVSFGNVTQEALGDILTRMGKHFEKPRAGCVGCILSKHLPSDALPIPVEVSEALCRKHLPREHAVPRFFAIKKAATESVGKSELQEAYDEVHADYEQFWLSEAAAPIEELAGRLEIESCRSVFEAGCGTGYGTALIAARLLESGVFVAVDLSEGMISEAKKRLEARGLKNVHFVAGDALDHLTANDNLDLIFSSWVLGYIPLKPFFEAANGALGRGGRLAFVVHRENSPQVPLEIFGEIVAEDPSVLLKRVAFDFPPDKEHVRRVAGAAGLEVRESWEGAITFRYDSPEAVLEHLLKSGAGTAFYDALDPAHRPALKAEFLRRLAKQNAPNRTYEVIHDYVSCIAVKP